MNPRLVNKIRKEGDCYIWTAAKDRDGYGRVRDGHRVVSAHRLSWEDANGPIPYDMCVGNDPTKCNQGRNCINPDHLILLKKRQTLIRSSRTEPGKHIRQRACKRGHPFSPDNTYLFRGERRCKTCQRIRQAIQRRRT